jgi:predicted metalloprotease with PDZ domain
MNPFCANVSRLSIAVLAGLLTPAWAQDGFEPARAAVPAPVDRAWPGVLDLAVDATDLEHRIQRVQLTLPVAAAGRLTLQYPRWLPGTHGPYGDIGALAGLHIAAGGRTLAWQRDLVDPYAIHVDVPAGAAALDIRFEHLGLLNRGGGRVTMTPSILGVQWNQVLLYPAGTYARAVRVAARVKLPPQWQQASALRDTRGQWPQADAEGWVRFAPASLETLVDSPLFAGRHTRRIELDPPGTARPVALNLVGDSVDQIAPTPAQVAAHQALVVQSDRLFGARHWRQYDFLLAISDQFGGIGLEHHESSENGVRSGYFKDWDKAIRARELLPHEYVHAWNGKFRRPADLWTPNYNVPMRNSLLWVYEGMTQYWGHVLAARSGLSSAEQARDRLAHVAASLDARSGRRWRNLQDTTNEGTIASRRDKPWWDWQRGADYYDEATLIWLDADTLIRDKTAGTRSLDDFARAFFGGATSTHADGSIKPSPYTFDELVATLNGVVAHDWAAFLRQRLDSHGPGAPLDGLARGGWKLVWSDSESAFAKAAEGWGGDSGRERPANFVYSLGFSITGNGRLDSVAWDSPAFRAGLAPGMTVLAVAMQAYKEDRLAAAISANKDGSAPVDLLVRDGDRFKTVRIDWRGGLRYPRLERVSDTPDRLSAIYSAK